jgi:hypothetical protein
LNYIGLNEQFSGSTTTSTTTPRPESGKPVTDLPLKPDQSCDGTWSYQPNPDDCASYYQCTNGMASKKICPNGLHWNQYSHSCDWPQYANCQSAATSPTTMSSTTTLSPWTPPSTTRPTTTTARPPSTPGPTQWQPTTASYPSGGCKTGIH